jgi:DNA-binding NtrC family response regulator
MVQEGRFRRDLYYRINVVSFTLPPLRERQEDISILAKYFADNSAVARKGGMTITEETLSVLRDYTWPGNVRELQNVIERAMILADGDQVTVEDLPSGVRKGQSLIQKLMDDRPSLAELEKAYITRLLEECGGHRARVADLLGISERTLYRKLKEL